MATVRIMEAVLVKPSDATPDHVLTLSALDAQHFLRFSIEYLLVFGPGEASPCDAASNIKLALAKTLVPYYPLAGRVRAKADGSGLEVVCKAQGAVFIHAVSEHYSLQDFSRAPRRVSQWRPFLSLHVADVLCGAPPVVLQLTWLKDDAAVLGIGLNHCLCDGIGSGEFLNSFADLASSKFRATQLKPKPVWNRELLDLPAKGAPHISPPCHLPEFSRINDVMGTMSASFLKDKLVPTSVRFDRRILNELKRVANVKSPTAFTSYEVLSAQVWISWASCLNLPPNQMLRLLFSVDIRNKLHPSLPVGYYGNAFILGCAETTVKDLTERGLGHVARLVREAKESANEDRVTSLLRLLSERRESCPDFTGVLVMSQWSRLGLEKMDFGMGRAVHVAPVCCDRYCVVLPGGGRNPEGDVRVMVAVPASGAAVYECLVKNPYAFI